jgi:tetratricopeptide (TPR) repeat protein
MRWSFAAVVLFAASAAFADAPGDQKKRADQLFEDGRRYLAQKEYALACTAFEQSHQADPAIGTELNLALCYEQWGHVAAAYRAYVEAERLAKLKQDARSTGARKKIDELAPKVPHLRIDIPADADVGAVFLLDGKEIDRAAFADDLLVEVGAHQIEARVAGKPPIVTKVDLAAGGRKQLRLDVPRPAPVGVVAPPPPRNKLRLFGGIAVGGAGAAALVVASVVALGARSDYNNEIVFCPGLACETHDAFKRTQDDIRRANAMTYVGIGGFVLVGAGVVLVAISGGKRAEPARVTATPIIAPGIAGISIGGPL